MMFRSSPAFLLLLLAVLSLGCTFHLHERQTGIALSGHVRDATQERVFTLDVPADMEPITLELSARPTDGSARWKLTDPDGDVRFDQRIADGGSVEQTVVLEPMQGTWKLERRLEGYSGWHRIRVRTVGGGDLRLSIRPD